jgi:hypothetical protein
MEFSIFAFRHKNATEYMNCFMIDIYLCTKFFHLSALTNIPDFRTKKSNSFFDIVCIHLIQFGAWLT